MNLLHENGLQSSLPNAVQSSTKEGTLIDNIFTDKQVYDSGRYISLISYYDPLWVRF